MLRCSQVRGVSQVVGDVKLDIGESRHHTPRRRNARNRAATTTDGITLRQKSHIAKRLMVVRITDYSLHLQLTECFVSFGTLGSVCLMVRWSTKTAYAALAFNSAFSASRRAMRSSGDSLRCTRSIPQAWATHCDQPQLPTA